MAMHLNSKIVKFNKEDFPYVETIERKDNNNKNP